MEFVSLIHIPDIAMPTYDVTVDQRVKEELQGNIVGKLDAGVAGKKVELFLLVPMVLVDHVVRVGNVVEHATHGPLAIKKHWHPLRRLA